MKKKGFTLVELLAVIVILAVIGIITIPLIGNVIKDSKKKALEQSVYGLVEAANYFTISNYGVYGFVFDKETKGETINGEKLDYKGEIDAKGELYIDNNGDISLCLENEDYYVYKNYNSGIYVGEIKDNNCIIGYDVLTNKYVAMLDDGTGQVSNVYSKDEVNNLIDSVNTNVTSNTNEITNIKGTIETLQNSLNNYALQSSIDTTNSNLESLSSIVASNTEAIRNLSNNVSFDYSSNPNINSPNEALQLMWDKLFPKSLNFINSGEMVNWSATGHTNNSSKISDDNRLYLSTSNTGTNSDSTVKSLIYTRNAVDLTYYDTLRIIGTASGYGATSYPVPISIQLVSESGVATTLHSAQYVGGSLPIDITKNISGIQGRYTIKVTLGKIGNWHTYYNFTTFQLY